MMKRFPARRLPTLAPAHPTTAAARSFDARSVMLFAALTVGAALLAHAQASAPAPAAAAKPGTGPQDVAAIFQRADADRDGQLSRTEAEYLPTVAQYFDRIDTNRDGGISLQELTAAVKPS